MANLGYWSCPIWQQHELVRDCTGSESGEQAIFLAALSSVERIRNQQKVLIEEHDSQIYKQGKNFFLKKLQI